MSTHAAIYYQNNAALMKDARATMPDLIKGFAGPHKSVMSAGTLAVTEKALIALAIGLSVRCENYIDAHVRAALASGASREQVLEAAGVAVLMQGGPNYTYLPRVTESLAALEVTAGTQTEGAMR